MIYLPWVTQIFERLPLAFVSLDVAEALLLAYSPPQESYVLSPIFCRRAAMEKSFFDVIPVDDTCVQWCMA